MGSWYESVLVGASATAIADSVGGKIQVAPAGADRAAMYCPESGWAESVAERMSLRTPTGAIAFWVMDSDFIRAVLYRGGEVVHRYVSEAIETEVYPFIDDNGEMKAYCQGEIVDYDPEMLPSGPQGAEPDWLLPFGVGEVDATRLGELLRCGGAPEGEASSSGRWIFAEAQHWAILKTLNLDPTYLAGYMD